MAKEFYLIEANWLNVINKDCVRGMGELVDSGRIDTMCTFTHETPNDIRVCSLFTCSDLIEGHLIKLKPEVI